MHILPNYNQFPQLNFRFNTTNSTLQVPLSKMAAVGLTFFLGYAFYKTVLGERKISEILGSRKAHPGAEREFFGFGSLKKAPLTGPFYIALSRKKV